MKEFAMEVLISPSADEGGRTGEKEGEKEKKSIGMIIFKATASEQIINEVLRNRRMKDMIHRELWSLQHGLYNQINGHILLAAIEQLDILRLWLFRNKRQRILQEMEHIKFRNLTHLMINYNQITSIEGMCRIYMPMLEAIGLIGNHITNMTPFKKCRFEHLNFLGLQTNLILDLSPLQSFDFDNSFTLLLERDYKDEPECQQMSWIFKLSNRTFLDLWMKSNKRINNPARLKIAMKCFTNLTIEVGLKKVLIN